MIITLKSANFGASNIGTLDSYIVSTTLGAGAYWNGPTYVRMGSSLTGTINLAEGYAVSDEGITVTMGDNPLTGAVSINDNVITISIANVTSVVRILVPTKYVEGLVSESISAFITNHPDLCKIKTTYKYSAESLEILSSSIYTSVIIPLDKYKIIHLSCLTGQEGNTVGPVLFLKGENLEKSLQKEIKNADIR
jgi:hypothetical protein